MLAALALAPWVLPQLPHRSPPSIDLSAAGQVGDYLSGTVGTALLVATLFYSVRQMSRSNELALMTEIARAIEETSKRVTNAASVAHGLRHWTEGNQSTPDASNPIPLLDYIHVMVEQSHPMNGLFLRRTHDLAIALADLADSLEQFDQLAGTKSMFTDAYRNLHLPTAFALKNLNLAPVSLWTSFASAPGPYRRAILEAFQPHFEELAKTK